MNPSDFHNLLVKMADAWSQKNYDFLATVFAEDIFYRDPIRYTHRGLQQLLEFFRSETTPEERCIIRSSFFDEKKQAGVAEYTYRGQNQYHGMVYIELRAGKITIWREYQYQTEQDWELFTSG